MDALRVVLVDNRKERRDLMVGVVEGAGGRATVVGEADGASLAAAAVAAEQADAVVVDVRMPVSEGLRTLRALRRSSPALAIVVCSFDLERATTRRVLAAGADACLAKPASPYDVVSALEAARRAAPLSCRALTELAATTGS
jgi:DNA-binding NarL/FixJ family response regulator